MVEHGAAEAAEDTIYIFGMNYFRGDTVQNIASGRCEMKISF